MRPRAKRVDRDSLTRWAELRNSCEGVHEVQAIEYFTAGCREGTVLKQRLLCDEPATLDELLVIADKYVTADSSMKTELRVDASRKVLTPAPKTPAGESSRRPYQNDHKRKAPQPASNSRLVTTIEEERPEGQPAPKKQKGGRPAWQPAFSYEQTLDTPASSTAARSRRTTPPGNSTGSPESPRETASCLPRLLGRRLHRRPSSRLSGQSAQYKTSTQKSMEPM